MRVRCGEFGAREPHGHAVTCLGPTSARHFERYLPRIFPKPIFGKIEHYRKCKKYLILLVGAARFELATPSPPDWCANRAALRSETVATIVIGHFARNIRSPSALPQRKVAVESVIALSV